MLTVRYGPQLAGWLLANADRLGHAAAAVVRPVMEAVSDPSRSLDRVGATLVSVQGDQRQVLGLLHQHTARLDGLSAGIDQVWAGQQVLGRSLDLLSSLSAIGLGVSVLSHAVLGFQLNAVNQKLGRLSVAVQQIQTLLRAQHKAALAAGIAQLQKGMAIPGRPDESARLFEDAASKLTDSSAVFAEQVQASLGGNDPGFVWVLVRHLVVSALGEAAAHLRLGQREAALLSLDRAMPAMRAHARAVFGRTVGADPARFLIPALAPHGVTLEAVAELYRQAGLAGAVDERPLSAAERFESLRGRLIAATDPLLFHGRKVERLVADWLEASAAVEEVNRLQGVMLAVRAYHAPDRTYDALADQLVGQAEAAAPPDGAVLAFFPPRASDDGAAGGPTPSA